MRPTLLLALPALQEVVSGGSRRIKYSLFPPLGLLTLAGMTPGERFRIVVRDEHVEPIPIEKGVDLVAMTVYVSSARRSWEIADRYRRLGAKVVVGGIHPTACPEEAARHADSVCIGPAEPVWPAILRDFERGRLRRFYRGSPRGSAAATPLPRRDLMNSRAYLVPQTIVSSRGCPHSCSFCYKTGFWGKEFHERRPPGAVARELRTFGGGFAFFLDDNFMADRAAARGVFAVTRERSILWQASASLDVARRPDFLAEARVAGCRSLFLGFESISKEAMRGAGKRVNAASDYAQAIRRIHDAGIMINGSFVFGFDHDDPDVFERTVEFAVRNGIETATFHILTPYPGTRLFPLLAGQGRILTRDWRRYDTGHAVFSPARMTPSMLEEGFRRAYESFYSWSSILRRSLPGPGALKRVAYNAGWRKADPLWDFLIRCGMLPACRPILSKVLSSASGAGTRDPAANAKRTGNAATRHAGGAPGSITPASSAWGAD